MAARAPPPPARLTEVEADKGVAPALAVHDQALHRGGRGGLADVEDASSALGGGSAGRSAKLRQRAGHWTVTLKETQSGVERGRCAATRPPSPL